MKKGIILLLIITLILSLFQTAFAQIYDISNHWASKEINYLVEREVLSGYPDGTFKPDNPITKAEFYKVINKLLNFEERADITYSDVNETDWYYEDVGKALAAGYISPATVLLPNEYITRQEVARILGFVYNLDDESESASVFSDSESILPEIRGYIGVLFENNLLHGYPDGTFKPSANITRAEVVKLIYNVLEKLNNLPIKVSANESEKVSDSSHRDTSVKRYTLTEGTNEITTHVKIRTGTVIGNVTIEYTGSADLKLPAGLTVDGDLTVIAPKATVNNYASVTGNIIIRDVASTTWNEYADGNILIVEDENGLVLHVVGNVRGITVSESTDGNITIALSRDVNTDAIEFIAIKGPVTLITQKLIQATIKEGTTIIVKSSIDGKEIEFTGTGEEVEILDGYPIVPVTINYLDEKTKEVIASVIEYSIDNGENWIAGPGSELDLIPGKDVIFRIAEMPSRELQTLIVPERPEGISFSYANSVSDYLMGLPAGATNIEARILAGERVYQDWTDITVDSDGKASLIHGGGDLIQVRTKAVTGSAFAGDIVQHYSKKSISELDIGDLVVDNSWQWEYKTGSGYSGTGELKPVTWIVAAKEHYGMDSGVTLLSKDLIGQFTFDNRTDVHHNGVNLWGPSNHIRPWLNSVGIYEENGFYNAFSIEFMNSVLMTDVPNEGYWEGKYTTQDKVFIPSITELGAPEVALEYYDEELDETFEIGITYVIGTVYPYFENASNSDRIAKLGASNFSYWTRSPEDWLKDIVHCILNDGSRGIYWGENLQAKDNNGVRPAVNIAPDTLISGIPNENGAYEIFYE